MSNIIDEVTIARKRRRRRYHRRRFIAAITIITIITAIVIIASNINLYTFRNIKDFFTVTFAKNDGYPAMLVSSKPITAKELKGATAILTGSEVILKGTRGSELFRYTHGYSNPAIDVGKTRLIIYDSGNKSYGILNRTGILYQDESELPIVSAAISNSGTVAVLTRGERSLAQLEVKSNIDYLSDFIWYGVSGFPLSCNFSLDNKEIYVVTLSATNSGIVSILTFIDLDKKIEVGEVTLGGMILEVYGDSRQYTVVTDKGVYLLNNEHKTDISYSFSRTPILSIAKSDNYLALSFGDNSKADVNYTIILSNELEPLVTIKDIGVVDGTYMTSDLLLVLTSGRVKGFTPLGVEISECELVTRAVNIFTVRNKLYLLLNDRIDLLEMVSLSETNKKSDE